jgi:hypothetical protein
MYIGSAGDEHVKRRTHRVSGAKKNNFLINDYNDDQQHYKSATDYNVSPANMSSKDPKSMPMTGTTNSRVNLNDTKRRGKSSHSEIQSFYSRKPSNCFVAPSRDSPIKNIEELNLSYYPKKH